MTFSAKQHYILVTGGAGYIGSHTVYELIKQGYKVIVYDDLSEGHRELVSDEALFIKGSVGNESEFGRIFSRYQIDTVIHFAGFISMGESMIDPGKYFKNNVCGILSLLDSLAKHEIHKFIFSSSAGVYGNPERIPIQEDDRTNPTNPYGESKLMVERCLQWYDICHGIKSISIRYFNAAGAAPDASLGEAHRVESHIIPLAIQTALGERETFKLFGDDYNTPDGTCVRDYIHVMDLADVHVRAIGELEKRPASTVYNAGTGCGYSNREIVEMVKSVTKTDFPVEMASRRPGDADILVASPKKLSDDFTWKPRHSDLENIVRTAYQWHTSDKYKRLKKAQPSAL